jgi:hypothetical protein
MIKDPLNNITTITYDLFSSPRKLTWLPDS